MGARADDIAVCHAYRAPGVVLLGRKCDTVKCHCAEDLARAALLTIHQHLIIESVEMTQSD
jgi:hypothetical protein